MKEQVIQVPESHKDITLGQYIKYAELKAKDMPLREFNKRKIMIFTNKTYKDVEKIEIESYVNLLKWIDAAIETDAEFEDRIELKGIEFGFIPNFDEMQAKEFFDLKTYKNEDENLHKIMAVLFRPVTNTDKLGNYEIEEYKGSSVYSGLMMELPMSFVFGAIFFFRNLRTELSNHILLYTELERVKEEERQSSLKGGGGTHPFMNWLKGKLGGSKKLSV